jgi:hypothetical protein
MRALTLTSCLALAGCGSGGVVAQQVPAAAPGADERLVVSADGATLPGGSGGGGGAVTWLRNLGVRGVVGAGAEYQQLADAHWTTGMLTGSLALGQGQLKTTLYAEAHEGAGDIDMRGFHYSLLVAGALTALTAQLSLQLEERRIDIDTSHGNLPKVGLSFRATPQLTASASYADSAGGNLGTRLGTVRIDYAGRGITAVAGAAGGYAAPAVLNLVGQIVRPAPTLREGFAGIGKRLGGADWLLLGDYQNLAGFKRTTITLACTLHLDSRGAVP